MNVGIIIPARDEEATVAGIVKRCRAQARSEDRLRVVVCDNGSIDRTPSEALCSGAEVVRSEQTGYGLACRTGIDHLDAWPDALLFIDADGSSLPEEMHLVLDPIRHDLADLVIGCRRERGPMTIPQRWGSRLASRLVELGWSHTCSDIGPFRAIRSEAFRRLGMEDRTWGWTVEMQILAIQCGLRMVEVPVSWKARLGGASKISGTVSGIVRAGGRILWTLAKYLFRRWVGRLKRSPNRGSADSESD